MQTFSYASKFLKNRGTNCWEFSPPPPQTAPVTQILTNIDNSTESPAPLPYDLDANKKFIQHEEEHD